MDPHQSPCLPPISDRRRHRGPRNRDHNVIPLYVDRGFLPFGWNRLFYSYVDHPVERLSEVQGCPGSLA